MVADVTATWGFPNRMRVGAGRINELPEACAEAGIARPLVVTDPSLAELPVFDKIRSALDTTDLGYGLFTGVRPNPVESNVDAAVASIREGGHDGVVAVGGGSALDVGKMAAFMVGQTRPIWDFEDIGDWWKRADAAGVVPVVAVPTTAGTGSEVSRSGVATNEAEGRKVIIFHPSMLPVQVISDPELSVGMPTFITVGTGFDALAHNLESICSPTFHPMAQAIGMEGCRLVLENLPRVVADPADLDARTRMLVAASMGAVAFQKGLGAMHALSHPIGAMFDTHHGTTNGVVMPYVLVANRSQAEAAVVELANRASIIGGFEGFVDHLVAMKSDTGIPHGLIELGVDPGAVDKIAAAAAVDPSAATNPVPCTPEFAAGVFGAACEGNLDDLG
ncbi:MAG: iron-containing alcohol dehydrogenase [Actinomycetota bacterium]|nr:iron-containing alcohol dehydrogenase [Actinomycetota bacterium]